ncbi:MAG: small, acid-soluble spore protein, alpha/beta type [Dethiobacteria bacterium]|nr:alpha/beta-type small acid-soluble spore protein [Bacillota bacterium]
MARRRNTNQILVKGAEQALEKFKYEIANELGVDYNNTDPGELTSRQNGYVGGIMVKRMIEQVQNQMAGKTQQP